MKKVLLLAMCLSASLLGGLSGANATSAASASPLFAIQNVEDESILTYSTEDDGKTLIISGSGDLTSQSNDVKTELRSKITDKSEYTKVVFKNTGETGTLKITGDIVKAILYTGDYACNKKMTTLDLGETTVDDLGVGTFFNDANSGWIMAQTSLTTLTLPLTKKDEDGGMTLPAYTVAYEGGQGWGGQGQFSTTGYKITFVVPTGYTKIGDNAFKGDKWSDHIILPEGLTEIGQSAFENCSALTDTHFPSTLQTIGKYAYMGCNSLSEVVCPTSLKTIECGAFCSLSNVKNIKFNEGLEYIGNAAFWCANQVNDQTTLIIPGSVQYIGPGAFLFREFQDIYYLGTKAPAEPMGVSGVPNVSFATTEATAFANNIYMGNNGFNPTSGTTGSVGTSGNISGEGEGNRQNYKNGSAYFCVLHFRGDLTKDQEETFTDITRHYQATGLNSTSGWSVNDMYDNVGKEETEMAYSGVTANKTVNTGYIDTYRGKQYTWPSQSQFMRSYVVNTWGYKWDGVTKYKYTTETALSEQQKQWIQNDPGIKGYSGTGGTLLSTISDCGNLTDEDYYLLAYLGTRRHVFIAMDATSSVDYDANIKAQKWQSLCLPCNVTKAGVDSIFGEGSQVCLFSKVERDKGTNKKLHLYFQNDTYRHRYVKQTDGSWLKDETNDVVGEDSIVIRANEAYMIYATKNPEGGKFIIENYDVEVGSPLPTVIQSNADATGVDADHTKYSFIGSRMTKGNIPDETTGEYANITIPQYSYFYANKEGTTYYKFYFNEYTDIPWQPGKCVVERYELRNSADDNKELFSGSTEKDNNAKQQSFFGLDSAVDDPTAIEDVEIICGQDKADASIYNLQGQYIGTSRSSLTKGVYVQNGKKFVVK